MKFAHMGDCHLGGWRQEGLALLSSQSFKFAIDKCLKEKVDFVLIAGDLFDSAYPPIETLKEAFGEFRKLKEANIPVFIIAGSHDYSASGKSFIDVLEKAGLCKNVFVFEEKDEKIYLFPTIYQNVAIYGYPGKKSGLEVDEIARIKLHDSPGLFKILMLHTAIRDAIGNIPINAVDEKQLPKVDYLAMAHLHIKYNKEGRVYSGPIFPNNLLELEELNHGSFYIFDNGKISRIEIKLKEVLTFDFEIKNAFDAASDILLEFDKHSLEDKIIILKVKGILETGKASDIDFKKIESYLQSKNCYSFLKSTTKLHLPDSEIKIESRDSPNMEADIIKIFEEKNNSKFNPLIDQLIKVLQVEKKEDERVAVFEERLLSESRRALGL